MTFHNLLHFFCTLLQFVPIAAASPSFIFPSLVSPSLASFALYDAALSGIERLTHLFARLPERIPLLDRLRQFDITLFSLGGAPVTLGSLLTLVALLTLLLYGARLLRRYLLRRVLTRWDMDVGTQQAISAVAYYAVLVIGAVVIVQNAGINLTTFHVVAGALGVGVGFGLQNIFSNFISGLIIMLERPIKVGDRIELGTVEGTVQTIGARRTTVVTYDQVAVIVPNQRCITDNVVNWLYLDQPVRLHLPLSVAGGTDARLVERLLLACAEKHDMVLRDPAPSVRLVSLGGPAMSFELLIWVIDGAQQRRQLISDLNYAIDQVLRENSIRTA